MDRVSFRSRDAQDNGLRHVSLEEPRVRRLVTQLPRVSASDPIPRLLSPSWRKASSVIGHCGGLALSISPPVPQRTSRFDK